MSTAAPNNGAPSETTAAAPDDGPPLEPPAAALDEGPTPEPPAADSAGVITLIAMALRRERDRTGLSLSEVARRAGVAKSTLSQLESGTGNPSVETLWALATALGVPFSRLVDPSRPGVRVIRAGEGPVLYAEHASYAATLLASCPPGARRDIYWIRAEPDEPRISAPHIPGTLEHMVLSTGRAQVGPVGELVEADPGDYVVYPGDIPHIFKALVPGTTAVMVLEHI